MSQTPGDTFNLCEVNPADVVGSVDNILTRLTNLEIIVARLLGWDLSVLQLSDLSQDAGMLQNVTQIFTNNTGLIQGMTYDTTLTMPQDGRDYYPIFNTELVDGILVYKIVAWIPRSGSGAPGVAGYASRHYDNGILLDDKSDGIAFEVVTDSTMIRLRVTVASSGHYIAGVSTDGVIATGSASTSYVTSQIIGMHGTVGDGPWDTTHPGKIPGDFATSMSDGDYLTAGTAFELYSIEVLNGVAVSPGHSWFWVMNLG